MSQYCSQSDILNYIDTTQLVGLTDDFNSGQVNSTILNNIITMASNKADALISSIYTPFGNNPPAKIKEASIVFSCYALWARRLTPEEKNQFKEQKEFWEQTLTKINSGELALDAQFGRAFPPVIANIQHNRVNAPIF